MVASLASIKFHDELHGRLQRHGTGTATIKAKLPRSLAWYNQCPFYQIYVDLKKAYDALDMEQTLNFLVAYGVGPRMLHTHFWDTAKLVCCAGGDYGEPFNAKRGITQRLDKDTTQDRIGNQGPKYWWHFMLTTNLLPLGTQVGCRCCLISLLDCLSRLVCSQMRPIQKLWYAPQDGYARPTQRNNKSKTNLRLD
jgi:hypothetical protein